MLVGVCVCVCVCDLATFAGASEIWDGRCVCMCVGSILPSSLFLLLLCIVPS